MSFPMWGQKGKVLGVGQRIQTLREQRIMVTLNVGRGHRFTQAGDINLVHEKCFVVN